MIIVKGEMPKGCIEKENGKYSECKRRIDCIYSDNNLINIRPYCCPIVGEIPNTHGRLIDADYVWLKIRSTKCAECKKFQTPFDYDKCYKNCHYKTVLKCLLEAPTVLEASK